MNPRRRLISYLILNILVSALVTGSIIFFYDRAHTVPCSPTLASAATIPPGVDEIKVNIIGIFGVGSISDERMVIQNNGSGELVLTGWYVTDTKGNSYTFPELTLYPGVKIQLHTAAGKNSPTDLYWGLQTPAWTSGELAALYDAHGIARAFYRIP